MTFYTGVPQKGNLLPVEGEQPLLRSLGAEVSEGFNQGPIVSWGEESRLARLNADPNAERYSKDDAQRILKEQKIDTINVPPDGLTKQYMDAVIQGHQEHLNRQQIMQGSPSGAIATPLKFMANLAGNIADPGNLAIGAIPFVGEARAATILGRAGQRFAQGAGYGALQTAATLPFIADSQAMQGNDFTMGDIASNLLLGTIGGGIIHAGGGFVADVLRSRDISRTRVNDVPGAPVERSPLPENGLPIESPSAEPFPTSVRTIHGDENYLSRAPAEDLRRSIDDYRQQYAYRTAFDDVVPGYVEGLQDVALGQVRGVNTIRDQISSLNEDMSALDGTLSDRTKAYQSQRMKFKDARAAALDDIRNEKQSIQSQIDDLTGQVDTHLSATRASEELTNLDRGVSSEALLNQISSRANEIQSALRESPIAQGVKSAAQQLGESDWMVRNQALRSAVSQMRRGEDVNIQPFLDLVDPQKKLTALDDLSATTRTPSMPDAEAASRAADEQVKASSKSDDALAQAEESLNYERQINDAIASEDPEFSALMKQIDDEAADTSLEKAIKAAAMCRIGRMNG